jgi:muramoyltetrapeptide carboxypeptidase
MSILPKLQVGDEVRIVAPSNSLKLISGENIQLATQKLERLGLKVSFAKNVNECDEFMSSSVASRVEDLHEAFADKNVKMIMPVIGGYNCNQLLKHLDYDLIKKNPKFLGGFSDTTALHNAIFAKTGLTTFQSPAFSTFAKLRNNEYVMEYFQKCFFESGGSEYEILPSEKWDDDTWFLDQQNYELFENEGFWFLQGNFENEIKGQIIGGNLGTLRLLQGTEFFPKIEGDAILFLEECAPSKAVDFERELQSVLHLPFFSQVKGLVLGRFQRESKVSREVLSKIISSKKELQNIPVIANLDFGHTYPAFSFPIGGRCRIEKGRVWVDV